MKTSQLQIRVSDREKAAIQRAARRAGLDVSKWVLGRLLPDAGARFQEALAVLATSPEPRYAVAELSDLLAGLSPTELRAAVSEPPRARLDPYWLNYTAAMVETATQQQGMSPAWTAEVTPLEHPVFGSDLESLRLYLLANALPAFRRRNIFVDATVGDRA